MNPTASRLLHAPEPRWPAAVALVAVSALHLALPPELALGSQWMLPALVVVLLIPTVITLRLNHHGLNHFFGFLSLAVVTVAEMASLGLLVISLPRHILLPGHLLKAAVALWVANVLVFALWYWRLDAGGPHARDMRSRHHPGAFLFPQLVLESHSTWRPHFIDYLFLSFNHCTAFSPTDTAVLSRWAKCLIMIQASISLVTVAVIAARAVNIL